MAFAIFTCVHYQCSLHIFPFGYFFAYLCIFASKNKDIIYCDFCVANVFVVSTIYTEQRSRCAKCGSLIKLTSHISNTHTFIVSRAYYLQWNAAFAGSQFVLFACKDRSPLLIHLLPPANVVCEGYVLHLSVSHSVHRGALPQCMLGYHTCSPRDHAPTPSQDKAHHPERG